MIEKGYEQLIEKREECVGKIDIYFPMAGIGFCLVGIGSLYPFLMFKTLSKSIIGIIIIGLILLIISVYHLYKAVSKRKEIDKTIREKYKAVIVKK